MNALASASENGVVELVAATREQDIPPVAFSPHVSASDTLTASWLAEATLRLRREICWLWYQRAGVVADIETTRLPPPANQLTESLESNRFQDDKQRMFSSDATAIYLTRKIETLRQSRTQIPDPWQALVQRLHLDDGAQFVFALGLLAYADPASGAVFAACHSDTSKTLPTLALAQRLYADAEGAFSGNSAQALFAHALLVTSGDAHTDNAAGWHQPYEASALVAHAILHDDGRLPAELRLPARLREPVKVPEAIALAANVLQEAPATMQFLPLLGDQGSDFSEWSTALSLLYHRTLVQLHQEPLPEAARLTALAAWCWLYSADVLLPMQRRSDAHARELTAWPRTPVRWLVPAHDAQALDNLPQAALKPAIRLPPTDFDTRLRRFHRALGARAQGLEPHIEEMARRFRLGPAAIEAIGAAAARDAGFDADVLHTLCRAQTKLDLGSLAQRVEPRFQLNDMVLPPAQKLQLAEIAQAMRALTRVHYRWGTARVWNDAGLSVVFCGPPGTGKTMAAEALAHELQLPMFRIDLSQVVNKYIGETEKNLARVFDAAEESDCMIFFDEADALFGKRTSVKDAHDRFANIEISYLLERMERLKGIAVLATNRRKDLDEAFLRRLRYLVEFPLPGERERETLWRGVFPAGVDTSALDFAALARLFPLAGGHIRSIAFNASLQAAREDQDPPSIGMVPVLFAVKRELDKLNRPNSPENFGPFEALVRPLFDEASA